MRTADPPRLRADVRQRLAKLLGMVGSSADGEALNAARLADRLLREHGATWFDALAAVPPPDPGAGPQPSTDDPLRRFATCEAACQFVLATTPMLTEWERTFVLRLPGFTKISHKQCNVLRGLVMRALATGAAR